MKRLQFVLAMVLAVLLVLPLSVTGTSLADNQGSSGKDQIIFVHYPHGNGSPFPATDQASNYRYTGIHWPYTAFPVHYTIDPTNPSSLATSDVENAINTAFTTWSAADTTPAVVVTYQYDGQATAPADPLAAADGKNTISWRSLGASLPGAIAVTAIWYHKDKGNKLIDETDTILNSDLTWSVNSPGATGFSSFDVQNIATHETGHWLLLNDLYARKDSELTMYGYGDIGETKKDTLGIGDTLGINAIYP